MPITVDSVVKVVLLLLLVFPSVLYELALINAKQNIFTKLFAQKHCRTLGNCTVASLKQNGLLFTLRFEAWTAIRLSCAPVLVDYAIEVPQE